MPDDKAPTWYKGDWKDSFKPVDPKDVFNTPFGKLSGDGNVVGGTDWGQYGKDLGVDAATQLPLALMPEAGIAKRAISSLLSGFGADQLLNRDKPVLNSAMDAGFNTLGSMLIPGMVENKISYQDPKTFGTGSGLKFLKGLNLVNPSNWSMEPRMMTRPGATQAVPANLGNIVKDFLTKTNGIPAPVKLGAAGITADDLNKLLKNGAGMGLNTLFDSTLNRPQNPAQ